MAILCKRNVHNLNKETPILVAGLRDAVAWDIILLGYNDKSVGNRFKMFRYKKNDIVFIGQNNRLFWPLKMKFQRCLEEPGTDYPMMRLCIPEERNPRFSILHVVLDARLSLSIITTATVLMTVDTTSLSPELLQTPWNKIAEFYSYVQVLKSRYSVGPPNRHVSYAADVYSHILLCCRLQSSMCVKIRHCGALPTDWLRVFFLCSWIVLHVAKSAVVQKNSAAR